jgi:putative esterase
MERRYMRHGRRIAAALGVAVALASAMIACRPRQSLQFSVVVPKARRSAAVDGRVLVLLSTDPKGEPRLQMREPRQQISANRNAKPTFQFFGVDVDALAPDTPVVVDATALGFPTESLGQVPAGDYTVQAVLNVYETFHRKDGHVIKAAPDHWEGQVWRTKPGNLYSEPQRVRIDPASSGTIRIALEKEIPALPYPKDTKYVKYVRLESKLLTEFWGRKTELGAWVLVPPGFDEHPEARYPLIVNPAHFPAELRAGARFVTEPPDPKLTGADKLAAEYDHKFYEDWTTGKMPRMLVMNIQHANPYYDDSYAVNSENVGPYGDAITKELIPYIEQKFRGIGQPWARMLTGCSTGGWEALGLQVFYPDFFNGTWVGAPSPIDLRAYRLVNIYEDKNAYWYQGPFLRVPRPSGGNRGPNDVMPADRIEDDHVGITMEQDNRAELVVGTHGRGAGLWDAMQAVFSPVGADGYPKPIWDKRTGVIDHEVADYWRDHYDLSYIMRRDWMTLGPKLVGKLHLTSGTSDQWYLTNAVRYVDAFLKSTKDPAYEGSVEYGDRFIHCYQGDPTVPLAISSRTVLQRQMPVMETRMLRTAPAGADVKSWRYRSSDLKAPTHVTEPGAKQ